jgi:glycosyltransferase involved in cell wall biosynthesis
MFSPFFSIITCTYNSAKYIGDNINSVKSQTFKNYEHIFVDGFSSDKTIELLNNYKSNNLNIKIVQSEARGIANAMNIGINNARGNFLLFLNSDDYLTNAESLENVFNEINKNPGYHWYYGMVNSVSENENKLYVYPSREYQKKFHYWLFRFIFFMQHPATFYNRNLFEKYGLYDELFSAMDYEYAVRIGKKERAKFIEVAVSNFRLGGFSSQNKEAMEEDIKKILKKYFYFSSLSICIRKLYTKFFVK